LKLKVRPSNNVGTALFVEGNNRGAGRRLRRRDGLRLVRSRLLLARRGVPGALQRLRHDKETGQAKYAIVQPRTSSPDRHRDRGRLERRCAPSLDVRSGHLV